MSASSSNAERACISAASAGSVQAPHNAWDDAADLACAAASRPVPTATSSPPLSSSALAFGDTAPVVGDDGNSSTAHQYFGSMQAHM
jgi:hypothetical protein